MLDDHDLERTRLDDVVAAALARPGRCVFLTGAGISAESGVPTFRGKDGYWLVGSRNYHAMELATRVAFERLPDAVWSWYLHRRRVCRAASPNAAHHALVQAAELLGERFLLITQNVDGLHRRSGSPEDRTYEIHGNIDFMRCSRGCPGLSPVPDLPETFDATKLHRVLACAACGAIARPHVLWFDELYDEALYRFESSLHAADDAALLVVVGTTGTTNLPLQIGQRAARRGTPLVVINPEPNPFSELVEAAASGLFLEGKAGDHVPEVTRALVRTMR